MHYYVPKHVAAIMFLINKCYVWRIFDGVIVYITQQNESQQVKKHELPSVATSYNKHYATSNQTDADKGAKWKPLETWISRSYSVC